MSDYKLYKITFIHHGKKKVSERLEHTDKSLNDIINSFEFQGSKNVEIVSVKMTKIDSDCRKIIDRIGKISTGLFDTIISVKSKLIRYFTVKKTEKMLSVIAAVIPVIRYDTVSFINTVERYTRVIGTDFQKSPDKYLPIISALKSNTDTILSCIVDSITHIKSVSKAYSTDFDNLKVQLNEVTDDFLKEIDTENDTKKELTDRLTSWINEYKKD